MGLLKAVRNSCNDIIEKSYSMGQYYGEVRKIKNEHKLQVQVGHPAVEKLVPS